MRTLMLLALPLALGAPAAAQTCRGDCNDDNRVSVAELVTGVQIVLGQAPPEACCDFGGCSAGSRPGVADIIHAVTFALDGCGCPDAFRSGAGHGPLGACVFRGPFSSACPGDEVAISFESVGGGSTDPHIAFDVAAPVVSFLGIGSSGEIVDISLDHWAPSRSVGTNSARITGTATRSLDGRRLTMHVTNGAPLVNGCRFGRFEGSFVGFQ